LAAWCEQPLKKARSSDLPWYQPEPREFLVGVVIDSTHCDRGLRITGAQLG
jgi:hypothetical protein